MNSDDSVEERWELQSTKVAIRRVICGTHGSKSCSTVGVIAVPCAGVSHIMGQSIETIVQSCWMEKETVKDRDFTPYGKDPSETLERRARPRLSES